HDQAVDTLARRSPRQRLSVVAGRDADHTASLLLRGERHELVEDAANLERPGLLEELRFEPDITERRRGEDRRAVDATADDVRGAEHGVTRHSRGHAGDTTGAGRVSRPTADNRAMLDDTERPVRLIVTDDLQRRRVTVLFRLILVIPAWIVFAFWS